MELTAPKEKATGEKDQQPRSNSGPTLYLGVSAMRVTETSRDPLSPIALMYRSQAAIQWHLRPAPRGWYCVQCDANSRVYE